MTTQSDETRVALWGALEVAAAARRLGMDCRDAGYVDRIEAENNLMRVALRKIASTDAPLSQDDMQIARDALGGQP